VLDTIMLSGTPPSFSNNASRVRLVHQQSAIDVLQKICILV